MSIEDTLKIKTLLYDHCLHYVQSLLDDADRGIRESREAANLEEKSSAGDKFETHRAMMHLQMESFIKRKKVAQALEKQLLSLQIKFMSHIQLGALIRTDQGDYFVGVSAPRVVLQGITYVCLSVDAPLYLAMQGLTSEDWIDWVGHKEGIEILNVY